MQSLGSPFQHTRLHVCSTIAHERIAWLAFANRQLTVIEHLTRNNHGDIDLTAALPVGIDRGQSAVHSSMAVSKPPSMQSQLDSLATKHSCVTLLFCDIVGESSAYSRP
jgi:hypothetical protein